MRVPSSYVWKRTALVAVIAALISISLSTGIRVVIGARSDTVTIVVRLLLPFLIAIPLGVFWFSRLEKLEESYRVAVKRANELARVASIDPLTGLLNRRSFIQQFNAANKAGVRGWFLIADIDYLKRINDQYGHPTGDDAVISVAQALEDCLSNDSLIARIGGDEFCAFVPKAETSNIDSVVADISSRASGLLNEKRPDKELPLSVSVGLATCKPRQTFEEVLALADERLYRKKSDRPQKRV
ncbi:GGDEF domain-containing protein [Brucella intermedia]|uniref:GGDEF domain-containing protein n=1 Tax=Brucella intermedia TaxID=94625 RepID=UPI00046A1EC9|nr:MULTISPECIES: GGDEF domain-containing protein [Brucella/Ochrobactrum group]OAB82847.1 diguanylate cyclase [Brucella intermedia]WGJ07902.1 GGDEF domain-containing protein [Brucella intermedia]